MALARNAARESKTQGAVGVELKGKAAWREAAAQRGNRRMRHSRQK